VNEDLLHILQHSLGLDRHGQGNQYRNRFVTGPGSTDFPKCVELVEAGYMKDCGPQEMMRGDHYFMVTEAGKTVVAKESPPPPKISRGRRRYLEFLDADCGMTFIEWLKAKRQQAQ
jgi:hypothetical protein